MPEVSTSQTLLLTILLQLERRARGLSREELPFMMVNETAQLLPYDQAVLWRVQPGGGVRIEAVSGVAVPDPGSPFALWLTGVVRGLAGREDAGAMHRLTSQGLREDQAGEWGDWLPANGLWLPLAAPGGVSLGGLVLFREAGWSDADMHVLSYLGDAYAHALALAEAPKRKFSRAGFLSRKRMFLVLLALFLAAMFYPMRQSVLAPAEVVSRSPVLIRAPYEGVVDQIHVEPNQEVEEGQLLLSLDDTHLRGRLAVARKAYELAQAEFQQASQQAFADVQAKARLALLKGAVEREAAEVAYIESLLERIQVKSPIKGVAVFDDPNDWLGRPVALGQKIFQVSRSDDAELEILLPASDAIALEPGTEVAFFLNVDPGRKITAKLRFASYQAVATPGGGMAYRLKAVFEGPPRGFRVGLRGTAKVYGERTVLGMVLFRKPINLVRQWLAS